MSCKLNYKGKEYTETELIDVLAKDYEILNKYSMFNNQSFQRSPETINVFETSHDTANWGEKYIKITVRQSLYHGGGYAEFYLNHQYNQNSLQIMHGGNKYGNNSGMTAQMTSLATVSGNIKKSTFQLVMGYYQHAYVTVQSNMTTSTSITAANQLKFF